jgi:hypothetical protein
VVRCVIEVDRPVIDELMAKELRLKHYRQTEDRESIRKTRKELESHPLQIDLLEQILTQLNSYKLYAYYNKKEKFVELYTLIQKNVRQIYESKVKWLKENPSAKESMDAQSSKIPIFGKDRVEKMVADIFFEEPI